MDNKNINNDVLVIIIGNNRIGTNDLDHIKIILITTITVGQSDEYYYVKYKYV